MSSRDKKKDNWKKQYAKNKEEYYAKIDEKQKGG